MVGYRDWQNVALVEELIQLVRTERVLGKAADPVGDVRKELIRRLEGDYEFGVPEVQARSSTDSE